jgi:hypothetical protein
VGDAIASRQEHCAVSLRFHIAAIMLVNNFKAQHQDADIIENIWLGQTLIF